MGYSGRWVVILLLSVLLMTGSPLIDVQEVTGADGEDWTYHDSYEMARNLSSLSNNFSKISEYTTAQEFLGTRNIPGNRTIPILFIGNRSDTTRKWIMLMGGHHGDEPDSSEAMLGFAHYILPAIQNGSLATEFSSGINIALLPVVNPYGIDTGSRYDENNEDPNRDYPFLPEGTSLHSDGIPLTTAGAHAVHHLAKMYPFSIALSFHTGSKGIFTPWGADGMESLAPDQNMFHDLGGVLSRASGFDLNHGPANDFGSLGYLKGAFDDHLYGASFYSHLLSSEEMILPWSTATATIEMDTGKGQNPARLGNLDGIFEPGSENDGTVPMGIRIALAACQLLVPTLQTEIEQNGNDISVEMTIEGPASLNVTIFTLSSNGTMIDLQYTVEEDPIFPIFNIRSVLAIANVSMNNVHFSMEYDTEWSTLMNNSDPVISPQAILSGSRSGSDGMVDLQWSFMGESQQPPVEPLERHNATILGIQPSYQEAGREAEITIDIPEELGLLVAIFIYTQVDWNIETTMIFGENLTTGTSTYEFNTPLLEGKATVTVNITTMNGTFSVNSTMTLYPKVYINTYTRSMEDPSIIIVMIGIDGSIGPVTVYYGVSRTLDVGWGEDGWLIGPTGIIAPDYGPLYLELDLRHLGGEVHLRVTNSPDGIGSSMNVFLDTGLTVTDPVIRFEGEDLVIGPSIILYRYDGLEEIDPLKYYIDYQVRIKDRDGEIVRVLDLSWMMVHQLNKDDKAELMRIIGEHGIDERQVSGCWIGKMEAPESSGNYSLMMSVVGNDTGHSQVIINGFDLDSLIEDAFYIQDKPSDDNNDFPVGLVIFLIVVLVVIFLISILRSNAHIREPAQGDLEERPRMAPSPHDSEE